MLMIACSGMAYDLQAAVMALSIFPRWEIFKTGPYTFPSSKYKHPPHLNSMKHGNIQM